MHVRVIYESGRDSGTKEFVEKTKLLEYLKWIGNDRKRLIRFTLLYGGASRIPSIFWR